MPPPKTLIDFLAAFNSINPWIAIYACLWHPGPDDQLVIVLSFCLIAVVFLTERGFRHLDFRASLASGIDVHADDASGPGPSDKP
jgi:hypothetical protein